MNESIVAELPIVIVPSASERRDSGLRRSVPRNGLETANSRRRAGVRFSSSGSSWF